MALLVILAATSAVGTFLLTFPARWLGRRFSMVALPDERRVHEKATPTSGGLAMLVAFLVTMVVAEHLGLARPIFAGSSEPLGILIAAVVIAGVGFIDDIREVSPPAKLFGQVVAAVVLYLLGVTMFYLKVPFSGVVVLSPSLTPLITALWVIGMVNAINLIDGLDGLAAGIVAIAAGSFAVYGAILVNQGQLQSTNIGPMVAAIACGLCLGFLPHNFHPARIFMGDTGAMLLGLLMAVSTMVVGGRSADVVSGDTFFFYAPLFIPFFILGVPIVDTVLAIVRRTARRSGISTADKQHLHHRLLEMGHGHRRAVLILWAWTAILSGFVLYPTFAHNGNALVPSGVAALAVVLYTLLPPSVRHRRRAAENGERRKAGVEGDDDSFDSAVSCGQIAGPIPDGATVQGRSDDSSEDGSEVDESSRPTQPGPWTAQEVALPDPDLVEPELVPFGPAEPGGPPTGSRGSRRRHAGRDYETVRRSWVDPGGSPTPGRVTSLAKASRSEGLGQGYTGDRNE